MSEIEITATGFPEEDAVEYLQQHGGRRRGFRKFMHEVGTLGRMAKAVAKGEYEMETQKIAMMYGALGYVVLPFDLVPDFVPFVGFGDDMVVVGATLSVLAYELLQFREWEHEREHAEVSA